MIKTIYDKLFKINDSPQKIALGLGLGVALGVVPGTGPVAALFLAVAFKINRAAALLGSLITNTWLSFATFLLALRIGSAIFKISTEALKSDWTGIFNNFQWENLFKVSFFRVILPIFSGYLIVSAVLGVTVYLVALIIIKKVKPDLNAGREEK